MPALIGPDTISASLIIEKRHNPVQACVAVMIDVVFSITLMLMLKSIHAFVRPREGRLIDRYTEIAGGNAADFGGTVAIDTIVQGVHTWAKVF